MNKDVWLNITGKTGGAFNNYLNMTSHAQKLEEIYSDRSFSKKLYS
jgi:hypothetical protein